eukprot:3568847-Ditylum_brightwellii.AAC.2
MSRVMAAAKNSMALSIKTPMSSGGSCHRQALPVAVYPPMPCSDASDQKRMLAAWKTMLLMEMPDAALVMNDIQSFKSVLVGPDAAEEVSAVGYDVPYVVEATNEALQLLVGGEAGVKDGSDCIGPLGGFFER